MSILGPARRRASRGILYSLVAICAASLGLLVLLGLNMDAAIQAIGETDHHDEVVSALQDSITLLKWVGGGIVTALVSAVGLLYRSLEKANLQSRQDILDQLKSREELVTQCLTSSDKMTDKVGDMTQSLDRLTDEVRRANTEKADG